ncbi:MAG: tRNA (guanosine(37)-N1)-methyltransferase TrmD [Actinobacteria bacterium]|jgi:tRNA (guanine37-N1)-methyltransferase|uniref:tRNA (guanine-N(1)-)-methyltransferase n=1 Tax=freshwater metagenome TaxID=449393 RepID=A0A6J7TZG9_9ZZZZ|nr:tRNA (guanosine(37)-N1)-methyltransferase TrmD [Actinomycetota bacterium]MSY00252.1 tRNA (guanosine(37)-N1)-methyltransferase TrmD [Actinomycetota bacterium]MTA49195.1 tRNA (guanosine(37)-N1)-methyltransferase TrmD [Actinomycetota bacterium]
MKIDAVTIFPEYFAPAQLSLLGKAQSKGLVDIQVHDLRAVTEDNHNTVDDTPYGGGAGMVMLPEVWGRVLDPLMVADTDLIILTPAGKRFNQEMAQSFANSKHLIFACGRYEGIDDRVRQHYESTEYSSKNVRVHEVSIGDYVLGGGEVASLVMIEAITRLIPGVLGNPESLAEESHNSEGYLEYPNFTKPQEWRGLQVPEVLLSGNHAEIAKWRELQAIERAKKNL